MKSLPLRRFSVLIGAIVGGLATVSIASRLKVPMSFDMLGWVVVGSVVGGTFVFLLTLVQLGSDSRYQQVRRQLPGAIVVQTYPSDTLDSSMATFGPWLIGDIPRFLITISISFDSTGIVFWVGSRTPRRLVGIPWSDVAELSVAPSQLKKGGLSAPIDRMRIAAAAFGYRGELLVGLERVDRLKPGSAFLPQEELADLIRRVNELRGLPGRSVAPGGSSGWLATSGLVSGVTAWSARRVSRLAVFPIAPVAAVIGLVGATLLAQKSFGLGYSLAAVAVLVAVVGVVATVVERRATARERAAGYTTLNGRELDLVQRHPTTGALLRQAGAPPLSDDDFEQLLGR